MRVLVTGAAGLYGVHLVDALVRKDYVTRVVGVDDFSRVFLQQDVFVPCPQLTNKFVLIRGRFQELTAEDIDAAGYDVVVHLAAGVSIPESMHKPEEYFLNNEYGTFRLIHTLLHTKKRPFFIYASSPEVYGNPLYVPMDVRHPMDPRSVYAVTKLAAEQHCKAVHQWYGYPVVTVRNFNTYGENQNAEDYSAVIPAFIRNALLGEPLVVEGDGSQTRDFMYVKDAVQAYVSLIERREELAGKIFNIGTGKQTAIGELARLIVTLSGSSSLVVPGRPRAVDLFSLEADISETSSLTGWTPRYSIAEGLERTIAWYRTILNQTETPQHYTVRTLRHYQPAGAV